MVGLYYSLGGGLGHGMRELALAREMARTVGGRHVLLVNSPFVDTLRMAVGGSGVELWTLSPTASPDEAGTWVERQCDELRPDLLVVDTFPRGLGGELATWLPGWRGGLKVLVSRVLPEAFVRRFQLASFSRQAFDLIFAPGEPSPLEADEVAVIRTAPWMVRRFEELLPPEDAAERLGCKRHERCVLVVGSGTLAECQEWIDWFRDLASHWPAVGPPLRLALPAEIANPEGVLPSSIVRQVPLVELMMGAAVVVGNAGYHLVNETRWLNVPARFVARRRLYDEQWNRLREEERAASLEELAAVLLKEFIRPAAGRIPVHPAEPNGVIEAAERIVPELRRCIERR